MGSQRAIRIFLLLMVIQLCCEILLARNSEKHSKPDVVIGTLIRKSKYSNRKYNIDDDIEDYYDTQYLDDDDSDTHTKHSNNTTNLRLLSDHRIHSNSDPHVTKVPARRSQFLDSEHRDNLRQLSNRMQYLESDPHVTKVPARRSQFLDSEHRDNLRQLSNRIQYSESDPHVTKVPARRSQFLDSEHRDNLRQLSNRMQYLESDPHVTKVPARRSQFLDSEHRDNLRQLSNRRQYSDSDPLVTEVPARRSQSLDSEYRDNLRQLSNRRRQYSDSDPYVTEVPSRRSKSSDDLDDSDYLEQYSDFSPLLDLRSRQLQRRNLEISPTLKSKHSDIEDTVVLNQPSDHERRYLHPEAAYVIGLVSARKLQAARKSSFRTPEYLDSDYVQQSNARENLNPAVESTKLDAKDSVLLPQVFFDDPKNSKRFHEDIIIACPRGTQFVVDRCELIFYSENANAKIKNTIRKSDTYLDDYDEDK